MARFTFQLVATCGFVLWLTTRCHAVEDKPPLLVTQLTGDVHIDGKLDEDCYQTAPAVADFVAAGVPDAHPQPTKAWLFWQPDRFLFAFEVSDKEIVAAPRSEREQDVDPQDRVELFLWSGRKNDTYYCLEIGALGAIHDYAARFYRKFDDGWKPKGLQVAVTQTPRGYCVEAELPRAATEAMGFALRPDERFRCGLFRADFARAQPEKPTWICWVDARGPQPDFHVAESFGRVRLVDKAAPVNVVPSPRRSEP